MATISAPAVSTEVPLDTSATPERRPLWQAPVFVVGVGALLAVWFGRPIWPDAPHRRLERELGDARQILSRSDGDAKHALRLAEQALQAAEAFPDRAGEANLLIGTAHARLAEREPDHWRMARTYLDEADKLGVPDADQPHLVYRLAKVGFHTGEDLTVVIPRLESSVAQADNRAEGYGLLTQAYLRLPKPNYAKALAANDKLRDLADASETELAGAKLLGGEILMKMGKPDAARKALEKIGEQAPPAVLTKARLLIARSYQDEGKWDEAATRYQAALADQRAQLPKEVLPRVYFDLGQCYRQREQPTDAARAWQDCVKSAKEGPEAQAAAMLLSEVLLQGAQPEFDKAVDLLTQAVAKVRKPADWKNSLMELARAREIVERAIQSCRQANQFDVALEKLLPILECVAPAIAPLVLRADLSADAAARQSEPGKAKELFKKAAIAYADAAKAEGVNAEDARRYLWLSAIDSQACADLTQAIGKFEAYLKLETGKARLGEGYFRLAECCRLTGNGEQAEDGYRKCLDQRTRFAYLARHQIALANLAAGDLDSAEAALVLNHKLLAFEPDAEALEKTLFTLGALHYQRRKYRDAVRPLAEALHLYKDNPEAIQAQYQLADSYRQIASQENQNFLLEVYKTEDARKQIQNEHRRWQRKAAEELTELAKVLDTANGKDKLTAEQRLQVPFFAAKCWFDAGEYQKALEIHEGLIVRHQGQPEELDALGGAIQCHAALHEPDKVRQRLLQIRQILPQQEEAIRGEWERWVEKASGTVGGL